MSEREAVLRDLAERARFYASLTSIGIAHDRPRPEAEGATTAPAEDLTAIREFIGDCQRCKLAGGRKNIVFGQGNPKAALMFVGEAPGADEDEQGLAFVGRAGQLLTDIIEKGLKMRRSEVWIGNVIKCRPPKGTTTRTPRGGTASPSGIRYVNGAWNGSGTATATGRPGMAWVL